ncbi:MAG: carboxymuconolactone decarboxylase family protein [Dehalococcoidia bacterium]|nr:carboxymuconolactone decarboxylase family protein [Dehalococcoidia bacterium]MCA9823894.1 carboxymuconolactone decarboxylase family protein [Dehalococcoidia bacterium]MCA9844035.1 carboxymuconolactone decarboxylase family protein [Dehalococcoidia bacterium]MCA9852358.1 carboxymuconolactone decarboxylase family protein [Dehalococcoidia bacterium]
MARLTPLDLDNLDPEQQRVADEIRSGPRGGLRGPFDAWLRAPGLAEHAQKVGAYVRYNSSLPRDLNELAILLTGKHWRAQFEFWAHSRLAIEAGLDPAIVEAVRTGQQPPFTRDEERVIYDFVTEYYATGRVSDANYERARAAFGEAGVVDLVGACGYYSLVSMTLNVFEVELPEGVEPPLGE